MANADDPAQPGREVTEILEDILAAAVIERSRAIRIAWKSLHQDEPVPPDVTFIDQAADEIKGLRSRIVARLRS